jgi:hypothetical protein
VADDVVDRCADRLRKAAIAERCRDGLLPIDDVVVADAVEFLGRNAGNHVLTDHVEHLGGQAARDSHRVLFRGGLHRHVAGAV